MIFFFATLQYLIYPLLYPLVVGPLAWLVPAIRARIQFERKNLTDESARSFRCQRLQAKMAVEVSSEGELEQVYPLLEKLLSRGDLVELIYCSASVEKGVARLISAYSSNLRTLRMPLLTYFPWRAGNLSNWITAPQLLLVRYDFFPELFLIGRKLRRFILISATIKGKIKASDPKWWQWVKRHYWQTIYRSFHLITTPSAEDKNELCRSLNLARRRVVVLEMRIDRIYRRLERRELIYNKAIFTRQLRDYLMQFAPERRLVMGSFWASEAPLLDHEGLRNDLKLKRWALVIFPHQLHATALDEIMHQLQQVTRGEVPLYLHRENGAMTGETLSFGIHVVAYKGILCEFYQMFGQAYVGGGFGRSIHSVLEPYLGGCQVFCGPKVFRSTEFSLIQALSPALVHRLEKLEDFYPCLSQNYRTPIDQVQRLDVVIQSQKAFAEFVNSFE